MAITTSSLTEKPLSNDVYPFDWLPLKLIPKIATDKETRISFERTCRRYHAYYTTDLHAATQALVQSVLSPDVSACVARVGAGSWKPLVEADDGRIMDIFYAAFEKRMMGFHFPPSSPTHYDMLILFLDNLLPSHLSCCETDQEKELLRQAISKALAKRIINDILLTFSEQPLCEITVEAFAELMALGYLGGRRLHDCFASYRGAEFGKLAKMILSRHSPETLETLRLAYLNPDPASATFIAVREKVRLKLTKEKEAFEAMIEKIRQKSEAADQEYKKALKSLDPLYTSLLKARNRTTFMHNPSFISALQAEICLGRLEGLPLKLLDEYVKEKEQIDARRISAGWIPPLDPCFKNIEAHLKGFVDKFKPGALDMATRDSMTRNAQFIADLLQAGTEAQ